MVEYVLKRDREFGGRAGLGAEINISFSNKLSLQSLCMNQMKRSSRELYKHEIHGEIPGVIDEGISSLQVTGMMRVVVITQGEFAV